ncbi:CopG family transcriptional regulator [Anaerolineae bacterium CFX7]|nr:CopG family transcriptional regulator [Anaerolineae bacterium CFX7]
MKVIEIELPDKVAVQLNELVTDGWFKDEQEIVRIAVLEFIRKRHFELLERFQRDDIAWALTYKTAKP